VKKLIILAACMALATAVQARLGETYDQCVARYGKPLSETDTTAVFSKPPFKITVGLIDNRAVYVFYEKPGSFMNESILKTERETLLEANSTGLQWSEYRCPERYKDQHILNDLWQRTDGAVACYEFKSNMLLIVQKSISHLLFNEGKKTTSGL
jgi:hypothetical protein